MKAKPPISSRQRAGKIRKLEGKDSPSEKFIIWKLFPKVRIFWLIICDSKLDCSENGSAVFIALMPKA